MGTIYRTSFMPYLELFEPRTAYVSELRLQHIWKNSLWKISRQDTLGRALKILSPGRHNHSDGPDFIGASLMLDGKLVCGDVEIHHRSQDWYGHKHHLDPAYDQCVLHVVFRDPAGTAEVKCRNGKVPALCYFSLEEALECENPDSCRIFKPDKAEYFEILSREGKERIRSKVRYFYENRLRFPSDIMLYWGLFKGCGYRYNEENMIKLFVSFPWAAYYDELIDRRDILPILKDLAGFNGENKKAEIRWTRSRTRPEHFPENRVDWLGKMMTHYYGASLSGMVYDIMKNGRDIFEILRQLFCLPQSRAPGATLRKEIAMNTVLPLMEAIRMDGRDDPKLKGRIYDCLYKTQIDKTYGAVRRFHDEHGIDTKDKRQKNWLIAQGVLNIQGKYCIQGDHLQCPICLMQNRDKDLSRH